MEIDRLVQIGETAIGNCLYQIAEIALEIVLEKNSVNSMDLTLCRAAKANTIRTPERITV